MRVGATATGDAQNPGAGHLPGAATVARGSGVSMALMMSRSRDEVLADLAACRRSAGRMTCKDENYPKVHATINALLDELECCG